LSAEGGAGGTSGAPGVGGAGGDGGGVGRPPRIEPGDAPEVVGDEDPLEDDDVCASANVGRRQVVAKSAARIVLPIGGL
jgi:hypothetical protein